MTLFVWITVCLKQVLFGCRRARIQLEVTLSERERSVVSVVPGNRKLSQRLTRVKWGKCLRRNSVARTLQPHCKCSGRLEFFYMRFDSRNADIDIIPRIFYTRLCIFGPRIRMDDDQLRDRIHRIFPLKCIGEWRENARWYLPRAWQESVRCARKIFK